MMLSYILKEVLDMAKKLKKIPYDLVSYITIETEAIEDSNDKMMISSYCLGKLKMVEWYIELLKVGSVKYIVPHSLSELESIRDQLKRCHDEIMRVKISKRNRPFIDIDYPSGYEG
jgi:hypothetical protein